MPDVIEKELWFKKKRYGWGWTPANGKGWAVIGVFIFLSILYPVLYPETFSPVIYSGISAVLIIGLICICFAKGEKPEWSWGDKK